ncbi:MAG TPA: hypothetical protein VF432_08865 [Thermoanaerobaculia bacterium]
MATRKFKELDQQAHDRFQERLKLLGIDPGDVPESVTISDGARSSGLLSKKIVVRDVAHLKAVGGIPDDDYTERHHSDRHIEYPELTDDLTRRFGAAKGDAGAVARLLTAEDRTTVGNAMRAFLLGNSSKVPQPFVDAINALEFPMEVTVTVGKDIVVNGEWLLGKDGPETVQAGTITIEPTGYIKCVDKVNIDVGIFARVN